MGDDFRLLLDRIRGMLDAREGDPEKPLLTEMEHTLTDGYAHALALEGELWRIEKRMGEIAGELERPEQAGELRSLAARLRDAEAELMRLRDLLVALRERVEATRAAVPETTSA